MASAILPSRNGPSSSDYMSKFTNNGYLDFSRFENMTTPNPFRVINPNPSRFFVGNTSRDVLWRHREQLPSCAPPEAGYRYITFRLGSYTRRELNELKKRLISDLERVRALRHRICSTRIPKKNYHPPQLELSTVPEVALTGKESQKCAVGQKRKKPSPSVRDTKKHCGRVKNNVQRSKVAMRKCGQILAKLMKHKHGWVFNTPVDAAALKLYDYHTIIKNPMDLGTIKSKLAKNEYESPLAFASDVRLTFQNAMVYNGKGSDVFLMAERLLLLFEDMFNLTHPKFVGNQLKKQNRSAKVPTMVEKSFSDAVFVLDKPVSNVTKWNGMVPQEAVFPGSMKAANLGQPLARDANKAEMTVQEKSELAAILLNLELGPEEMDQIMAITKKGVLGLEREGDEIELDLGVLDNETLWELHSFIGSSRKKAAATSNMKGLNTNLVSSVQDNNSPAIEPLLEEQGRKRDAEEEDIDIGEDIRLTNFPSVEIQKDAVNVGTSSSCSSSSGTDSSSSDSDTDSSSGDDSEDEGNGSIEQKANSTLRGGSMGI